MNQHKRWIFRRYRLAALFLVFCEEEKEERRQLLSIRKVKKSIRRKGMKDAFALNSNHR